MCSAKPPLPTPAGTAADRMGQWRTSPGTSFQAQPHERQTATHHTLLEAPQHTADPQSGAVPVPVGAVRVDRTDCFWAVDVYQAHRRSPTSTCGALYQPATTARRSVIRNAIELPNVPAAVVPSRVELEQSRSCQRPAPAVPYETLKRRRTNMQRRTYAFPERSLASSGPPNTSLQRTRYARR